MTVAEWHSFLEWLSESHSEEERAEILAWDLRPHIRRWRDEVSAAADADAALFDQWVEESGIGSGSRSLY